uniref:Paramyosin n=1 Tax=Clastoptera arizonana TaxID=38151 RepID=A0A1B6CN10_9HEMI
MEKSYRISRKTRVDEKWKKPPTFVYEDNYGYGIQFYQPLINFIDTKKQGVLKNFEIASRDDRFWRKEKVIPYSNQKLRELADEAQWKAKQYLELEGLPTYERERSKAALSGIATASSLNKHIKSISLNKKVLRKKAKVVEDINMENDFFVEPPIHSGVRLAKENLKGRSARSIEAQLKFESFMNLSEQTDVNIKQFQRKHPVTFVHDSLQHRAEMNQREIVLQVNLEKLLKPLDDLRFELEGFDHRTSEYFLDKSKQTSIEIEQLNARVVEAETRLKTEVTRIKKKLQITITELELSLDVANKNNLELQKTVKKQSLQLTELQGHYDEIQRQLAVTLDQYAITTRKVQSLTGELEEIRGNYDQALRSKRIAEQMYEESQGKVNELITINTNLSATRAKIEQELQTLASDYEEVTKELKISDERYQRAQVELKHTVEILHEEQERIIKIEAIKKSLEIEVKNLSVRLEEVEANAIVGGKRIISKLEARIRDLELELDEEKRRHAETLKILRKKERLVKEIAVQQEEDAKNISLLQEQLDKVVQKVNIYKRQLQEQEGLSAQSVTRVRRFQRELEAAEDRADCAESNLSLIRAKHRTFVTTSTVPGSQVYMVQETRTTRDEAF